jgi:phospholipase/carboxylesterase
VPEETIDIGPCRVIAVGDRSTAQIVIMLLHGFAMTPSDLSPFAHSLGVPAWFLFPEGPLPAAPQGRAWWHIDPVLREASIAEGPRDFAGQHPPDLPRARELLNTLLDRTVDEANGRPLIVGGFSQGGMLTCDTIVRAGRAVAGMLLLSTSRIAYDEWPPYLEAGNVHGLPTLVSHGQSDPDLAFAAGVALKECLSKAGADVTWVPFGEGHEIPLPVWREVRKFVGRLVPAPALR